MSAFSFDAREDRLDITWADGASASFPWLWLADNEPEAFHPQTEERTFDLLGVPPDVRPASIEAVDNDVLLAWPGREKATRISAEWLRIHAPGRLRADAAAVPLQRWGGGRESAELPRYHAPDILADDAMLLAWMLDTVRFGLSIVDGVRADAQAGVEVAERAGFLRRTNFGTTFTVVSKPDPNNLAYTSHALALHTDLANQEVPPGYQFLHCLANEAQGGGSVFCDGFAVAADLLRDDASAFAALAEIEIPFRFHDRDYDIRGRFPVIVCDRGGEVREIRFNAHLVDIVDLAEPELSRFYSAYRIFMRGLRDTAYTRAFRLAAGEMVVFDNRRVLHGRQAFNPSTGFRHLSGCYVDRGEFLSRIRVLSRAHT